MPLKHKTLPAGTDRPGFAGVTPSLYAEEHLFSGGAHGSILTRNTLNSDGAGWVASAAGILLSTGAAVLPSFSTTLPTAVQDNITRTGIVVSGTWSGLFGAVTGANLTSLTAANLSGTITSSVQDNITRTGTITSGTWSGLFGAVSGANLTTLNAANISSGLLADARLTSNIPLINGSNTFSNAAPIVLGASTKGTLRTDVAGYFLLQSGSTGFRWVNNANSATRMELSDSGLLSVSGFGTHTFSASGTGAQLLKIANTNAGSTTNYAGMQLDIDAGATAATFKLLSNSFTTSGSSIANGLTINVGGTGGLNLVAINGSGAMRFYTGGDNLRWGINSSGDTTFGASSHIADSNGTPTIASGFGTSASVLGNDYAMVILPGTSSSSSGVVNFGHTFNTAPVAVATRNITDGGVVSCSTSTTALTLAYTGGSVTNLPIYVLVRGY